MRISTERLSKVNELKVVLLFLAGQERFRSITQSYYRSAHALILVYDISCQPTFDALTDWIREIQEVSNSIQKRSQYFSSCETHFRIHLCRIQGENQNYFHKSFDDINFNSRCFFFLQYANPKVLKILVGNKTDRDDREIPLRVGEDFAKQHEMYFLETSSKQGENGKLKLKLWLNYFTTCFP